MIRHTFKTNIHYHRYDVELKVKVNPFREVSPGKYVISVAERDRIRKVVVDGIAEARTHFEVLPKPTVWNTDNEDGSTTTHKYIHENVVMVSVTSTENGLEVDLVDGKYVARGGITFLGKYDFSSSVLERIDEWRTYASDAEFDAESAAWKERERIRIAAIEGSPRGICLKEIMDTTDRLNAAEAIVAARKPGTIRAANKEVKLLTAHLRVLNVRLATFHD
jgi:hypothetical protein